MRQLLTAILFLPMISIGQDSLNKKLKVLTAFEIAGRQHFYQPYIITKQPSAIKDLRRNSTTLPINFDTVTDNPFGHGAIYMAIKTTATYENKINLKAALYAEYRGISYGTFNTKNNLLVYPVIILEARDTIRIWNEELIAEGRVGQFTNERLEEGIMIYNIDLQGTQLGFRHKRSRIGLTIYGDLSNAIGLNADDVWAVSYEYFFKKDSGRIGFSRLTAAPSYAPTKYHSYFNLFARVSTRKGFCFYGEMSYTPNSATFFPGLNRFSKKIGVVVGAEYTGENRKVKWKDMLEARYYGPVYNLFHHQSKLLYRKPASNSGEMYANTVGEYLYPLRKFDTPFSQWAVFTEYSGYSVGVLTLNGQLDYKLAQKLGTGVEYDINAIKARLDENFGVNPAEGRNSFFIYPFFKAAIWYSPVKESKISLFISNKSMNLDLSYPSFYLHNKVFFGAEFYCRLHSSH